MLRSLFWYRTTTRMVMISIPGGVIGIFLLTQFSRSQYGPRGDLRSNRNEYQEYFLEVNVADAYGREL
jgi:hypothetical protein